MPPVHLPLPLPGCSRKNFAGDKVPSGSHIVINMPRCDLLNVIFCSTTQISVIFLRFQILKSRQICGLQKLKVQRPLTLDQGMCPGPHYIF